MVGWYTFVKDYLGKNRRRQSVMTGSGQLGLEFEVASAGLMAGLLRSDWLFSFCRGPKSNEGNKATNKAIERSGFPFASERVNC